MAKPSNAPHFDPLYGLELPQHGWVPAPRYLMRRDRILRYLQGRRPPGSLLEVGCGSGALLEDFRRIGFRCSAVEVSDAARAIAQDVHRENRDIEFHDRFSRELEAGFDILVSCEVIEHIEDDAAALRLWASALKPGGEAIISTPANPARFNALDRWAGHFRRYTKDSFSQLCQKAGLQPIRFEFYGYPLVELTERLRGWLCERQLRREQVDASANMQRATEKSGIDRSLEMKLYPLLSSYPGRLLFKSLLRLQGRYLCREIGNGMLCFARKE